MQPKPSRSRDEHGATGPGQSRIFWVLFASHCHRLGGIEPATL